MDGFLRWAGVSGMAGWECTEFQAVWRMSRAHATTDPCLLTGRDLTSELLPSCRGLGSLAPLLKQRRRPGLSRAQLTGEIIETARQPAWVVLYLPVDAGRGPVPWSTWLF